MAHEIEQMIYTQETPWHKIGDYLGDMDGVTVDALRQSHPVYFSTLNATPLFTGSGMEARDVFGFIRSHDGKLVSSGGPQLAKGITHPCRVMESVDNILGTGKAVIHTCGFLRDGSRMFVLCKLSGENIKVKGTDDQIETYLNLVVAFDGTMSMSYLFTPVRVVCANTQSMALAGAKDIVRVKQTVNAENRRLAAEQAIREGLEFYQELQVKLDVLAELKLSEQQIDNVLRQSFSRPGSDLTNGDPLKTRTKNTFDKVRQLSVMGVNSDDQAMLANFQGSAYALWQGITSYADHDMVVRGARTDKETPQTIEQHSKILDSIWFGNAANLKNKAWDAIGSLAGF